MFSKDAQDHTMLRLVMDDVFGVVAQVLNLTVLAMNVFVKMGTTKLARMTSKEELAPVSIIVAY
jgi:hypothetical protein